MTNGKLYWMDNIIGLEKNHEAISMKISLDEARREFPDLKGVPFDEYIIRVHRWYNTWFGATNEVV